MERKILNMRKITNFKSQEPLYLYNGIENISKDIATYGEKHHVKNDKLLESKITVSNLKSIIIKRLLNCIRPNDLKVFECLINSKDNLFYTNKEIITTVQDVAYKIFDSSDEVYCSMVKINIINLNNSESIVVNDSLEGFTISLLSNIDFGILGLDNEGMIKATIDIDIINEIIKTITLNMHKNIIDNMNLDFSKILAVEIQNQRIPQLLGGTTTLYTNLNFFRNKFLWDEQKAKNIEKLEKSLNEIIENKIIIKKYTRTDDKFNLEFYPLSKEEEQHLLVDKIVF